MTHYLIIGNLNYYTFEGRRQYKMSWNKAYELCQHFSADLPSFMSRDENDEFISLMLKSEHIPFIEATFIGLKFNKEVIMILSSLIQNIHVEKIIKGCFITG